MTTPTLYRDHLATLDRMLQDALAWAARGGVAVDGLLLHAGRPLVHHRDDQEAPFHPTPHFARYLPLDGPDHCLVVRPGQRPRLVRVAPRDFWYAVDQPPASYWQAELELCEVASFAELVRELGSTRGLAYLGNAPAAAAELGVPAALVEPAPLVAALDWHRATKTDLEIALVRRAAERAAAGHRAARDAFAAGASELEVHWAYLRGSRSLEREMPFETIVAYDAHSATLHYQHKNAAPPSPGHTLLVDAGALCDGYAADITRTWVRPDADPTFAALLTGVDRLQRRLVALVEPERDYVDIHLAAHQEIARLLVEAGVARGSVEELVSAGVSRAFFPHGVGHHLGLQVHDVGGQLASPAGDRRPPPPEHRFLRNTRRLAAGHLVTIEPGLYFIPVLLDQLRAGPAAPLVDWPLVDRLSPLGGIRVEDDVVCTSGAPRDLTRELIA